MSEYRNIFPKSLEEAELLTYIDYNKRISKDIASSKESKLDIENVMQGHILEETQLIGTYEKKKKFLFF